MTLWSEDLPWYPVEVCIAHKRFVPCRRDDPHVYSTELADVETVRLYQQSSEGNE